MNQESVKFVDFTIRLDRYQGILVETLSTENDEYFFKTHHQPIKTHCAQMQLIVRHAGVQRTKKIRVDIGAFKYEYFNGEIATFKGCPLASVNRQIDKVCNTYINKELGAMKRAATVAHTKQQKKTEKNQKILDKMTEAEKHFQVMRAKRLAELMGQTNPVTASPSSGTPSTSSASSQSPGIRIVPTARINPHDPTPSTSGTGQQIPDADVAMNTALPYDSDD